MSVPARQRAAKPATDPKVRSAPEISLFDAFNPLKQKRLAILDEHGKIVDPQWAPLLSEERLLLGYRTMLLARVADLKAVSLQRQGRLFTLPPNIGQEASAVGSALALEAADWMVPAYRELGAWLLKGVPLERVYMYHGGSEFGNVITAGTRVLPTSVPIASQLLHAAGIGHAINYRGGREIVITYFGDGGTSEGDFHEALNWAGVFNCPVIFFCNNNQYAISLPRERQTRAETLAQKAVAYGIKGIQVDGNDMLAVYRATQAAADHARAGNGPVLIESVTYRLGAHTTSDDPTKYRDSEEEALWKLRDPLLRMRRFLESQNLWSEQRETHAMADAQQQADAAFQKAEKWPANSPDEIFNHVYEQAPPELQRQSASLKAFLKWKEGR